MPTQTGGKRLPRRKSMSRRPAATRVDRDVHAAIKRETTRLDALRVRVLRAAKSVYLASIYQEDGAFITATSCADRAERELANALEYLRAKRWRVAVVTLDDPCAACGHPSSDHAHGKGACTLCGIACSRFERMSENADTFGAVVGGAS